MKDGRKLSVTDGTKMRDIIKIIGLGIIHTSTNFSKTSI